MGQKKTFPIFVGIFEFGLLKKGMFLTPVGMKCCPKGEEQCLSQKITVVKANVIAVPVDSNAAAVIPLADQIGAKNRPEKGCVERRKTPSKRTRNELVCPNRW